MRENNRWRVLFIFMGLLSGCLARSEPGLKTDVWRHLNHAGISIEAGHEDAVAAGVTALTGKSGEVDIKIVERSDGSVVAPKIYDEIERGLDSMFRPHEMPYAGAASPKLGCGVQEGVLFRLDKPGENWKRGFIVRANERQVPVSCPSAETAGVLLRMVVLCAKANVAYELKIYEAGSTADHLRKLFDRFLCES